MKGGIYMIRKCVLIVAIVLLLNSVAFAYIGQTYGQNIYLHPSLLGTGGVGLPIDFYIGTMIQNQALNHYVGIAAFQNQIGDSFSLLPNILNPLLQPSDLNISYHYQSTDSQYLYSHYVSLSYSQLPGTNSNTVSMIQNQFQSIIGSGSSAAQ
jgi:hypothetical protein